MKNGPHRAAEGEVELQPQYLPGAALQHHRVVQHSGPQGRFQAVLQGEKLQEGGLYVRQLFCSAALLPQQGSPPRLQLLPLPVKALAAGLVLPGRQGTLQAQGQKPLLPGGQGRQSTLRLGQPPPAGLKLLRPAEQAEDRVRQGLPAGNQGGEEGGQDAVELRRLHRGEGTACPALGAGHPAHPHLPGLPAPAADLPVEAGTVEGAAEFSTVWVAVVEVRGAFVGPGLAAAGFIQGVGPVPQLFRDQGGDGRVPVGGPLALLQLDRQIVNFGENGREIPRRPWEVQRLEEALKRSSPVDAVVILLGSNDLLQMFPPQAEVVVERMRALLAWLLVRRGQWGGQTQFLLAAPPPMRRGAWVADDAWGEASRHLAEQYGALAREQGIAFADGGAWGVELAFDGVHFTQRGHLAFAQGMDRTLRDLGL